MFKKTTFFFTLFLFSILLANFSIAQDAETTDPFSDEAAISDNDIKAMTNIIPELEKIEGNNRAIDAKLEKYNISRMRFIYLSSKIPHTLMIILKEPGWEETIQNLPESLKPTTEEIKLVEKHKNDLIKAFNIKID